MRPTDNNKTQARRVVSERLRLFFAQWKQHLASGAEELWARVEGKLDRNKEQ